MPVAPLPRMAEAEYLAWEETQTEKHEFVNGEIVAMSGVSDAHNRVQVNLAGALIPRLRGSPCRLNLSELRVRIAETGLYAYPDLTIVCGPAEYAPTRPESLVNPRVIIEVLSEATANYDLGAKAAHYRHRPSVETLLFVDSRARLVQRQDRNPDGTWTLAEQTAGEVRLLDFVVPMDEIYEAVALSG